MRHILDDNGIETIDGVLHMNRRVALGCPACGQRGEKRSETPGGATFVLHHNPTECCAWACTRFMRHRQNELDVLRAEQEQESLSVQRIEEEAENATGREKDRMERKATHARQGLWRKERDYYEPRTRELLGEYKRVRDKREGLLRQGDQSEASMKGREGAS